jgi:hypothetical protein
MKRKAALLLTVVLVPLLIASIARAGSSGDSGNATELRPPIFVTETLIGQVFTLDFNAPTDTFQFTVTGDGAYFGVETEDCCLPGDHFLVTINSTEAGGDLGQVNSTASACGSGATGRYSGPAASTLIAGQTYKVTVAYCSGVDVFPGTMRVKFSSPNPLVVTPL